MTADLKIYSNKKDQKIFLFLKIKTKNIKGSKNISISKNKNQEILKLKKMKDWSTYK